VIPTLCTLGNLLAGFAAIHVAAREPAVRVLWQEWTALTFAGALVFLGMFLDAIDGTLARLTRSNSELGGQLDSLADVITFGVAPAFMTIRLVQNHLSGEGWLIGPDADIVWGRIIWAAAAVYVCCAALRLARFNVEMGPGTVNDHSLFRGLPSPGAAGTIASLIILHQHLIHKFSDSPWFVQVAKWSTLSIALALLLCAFGMVSSIPYVHFANRYFRGRKNYAYLVRLAIIAVLLIVWFRETVALGFLVYALSGPFRMISYRFKNRTAAASP
jgi:CDP-diacylglycerol--serine O-phosphatidyltransferase